MIVLSLTMCIQTQEPVSMKKLYGVQHIAKCCFPFVITVSDSVLSPSKFDADMHIFGMKVLHRLNRSSHCAIRTIKKYRIYLNS